MECYIRFSEQSQMGGISVRGDVAYIITRVEEFLEGRTDIYIVPEGDDPITSRAEWEAWKRRHDK